MKRILIALILVLTLGTFVSCSDSITTITNTSVDMLSKYKIVFYSGRSGNNEIYMIDTNGGNLINLSNNSADDNVPAVSLDGTSIAFVSNRDGVANVYIMSITGENVQRITESNTETTHPSWSSDGMKLLYVVDFGNKTEIWMIDRDGQNNKQLTDNDYRDERPVFSPDMSTILFMSNREGKYRIYTMDINGENQKKISIEGIEDTNLHYVFPQYNLDGTKTIFSLNNSTNMYAEIHISNMDGTGDIRLTEIGGRNENPSFSPNGEWIVFQSERDGNFEIYIMKNDGTESTRITNNSSWDGWPSWVNFNE